MTTGAKAAIGSGWGRGPLRALALAAVLVSVVAFPASAQMFSDRPPPVPPAAVPDVPSGPAMNLAPPSSPPPPNLLAPLTQPSLGVVPSIAPQVAAPLQGMLSLTARYGKDLAAINGGLVWRVFPDR